MIPSSSISSADSLAEHDPIAQFRAHFHRSPARIHLNNAGQSPITIPAYRALQKWAQSFLEMGAWSWFQIEKPLGEARASLASFLGCHNHELAFFQGAAGAISQMAFGLDLKAGDEIVIWDQEYPSNFYPWAEAAKRSGAKIVFARSEANSATPLENIEAVISPRTRVIATSWVQFRRGAIIDLKALSDLARPRGIFTSVDVIQGAGILPFDFHALGIDAACGGSHKWLASPHGAGFLCLREDHIERIRPLMFGAMTFAGPDTPLDPLVEISPRFGAERLEPGGKPLLEILAIGESARLFQSTGIERIAHEAEQLAQQLVRGLKERGYVIHSPHGSHHRGAIVNFAPPPGGQPSTKFKTLEDLCRHFDERSVSYAVRPPGVRLAPHAHNTAEEIARVLEGL